MIIRQSSRIKAVLQALLQLSNLKGQKVGRWHKVVGAAYKTIKAN